MAYSQIAFITATNASYSLPAGWNNSDNKIECIGRGGNGSARNAAADAGNGGGGGAYCSATNQNLGAGPIAVQVGTNTSAVVTQVNNTGGTTVVRADYGRNATTTAIGAGGIIANNIPANTGYYGGDGTANVGSSGGGGGGSAGPNGVGYSSGSPSGGAADGGTVAGGTLNNPGPSGTEWDSSHGCGGGGGGGSGSGQKPGGAGGTYGGGAGGSNDGSQSTGGIGAAGLIILQWNPVVLPNTGFLQMF